MASETQNAKPAAKAPAAVRRAAEADARQTTRVASAEAKQTKEAARKQAAQLQREAKADAREIREAAEVDARATVEAVAKDNVQAASELTRRVWERNIELAVSMVPAYLDAYERAAQSFSALYRQTGETAGRIGEGGTAAPRAVGEVLVKAGEAASQAPQAVGESFSEVVAVLSRMPAVVGASLSGQAPQAVPALFGAQADLIRETAEATASATRERLAH
jgi:hypothetical protein